jgi:hypothetical protein
MDGITQPPRGANNGGTPVHSSPALPEQKSSNRILVVAIIAALLLLALIIAAIVFLLQPATPTERIRDIFIIFMALVSLLIGLALVILIAQVASLINLLQNEIKPILESTQETANTLRGTSIFLSDHLAGPVIKLGQAAAAVRTFLGFQQLFRDKPSKSKR